APAWWRSGTLERGEIRLERPPRVAVEPERHEPGRAEQPAIGRSCTRLETHIVADRCVLLREQLEERHAADELLERAQAPRQLGCAHVVEHVGAHDDVERPAELQPPEPAERAKPYAARATEARDRVRARVHADVAHAGARMPDQGAPRSLAAAHIEHAPDR